MSDIFSIELEFDEELFKKGEELYHSGAVLEIIKLNSSLFSLMVKEGKIYEVELQRPLTKSQKATCDCTFFESNKTCRHIAAGLLFYQRFEEHKKDRKKDQVRQKRKSKSISIKSLLNNVSHEELKSFVQAYASSEKRFSDALKVSFIRKIDLVDNERKYKVLLDSLIRPVSSIDQKLKLSELRNFKNVVHDLLEQSHDAMALGEYVEASLIIKTVLSKLHYIQHYYTEQYGEVQSLMIDYYKGLMETLEIEDLSIDLREEIVSYLFNLVNRSYYHATLNVYNGFELIIGYFEDHRKEVLQILEDKLEDYKVMSKSELAILYGICFRLRVLLNIENPFELPTDLMPISERIISAILEMDEMNVAHDAVKHFKSQHPYEILYTTLLLEMYVKMKDRHSFVETVLTSFGKSKDLRIVELVKKFGNEEVLEEVRVKMQDALPSNMTRKKEAELYFRLEDWESLMKHLYSAKELILLRKYDRRLKEEGYDKEVEYLYLHCVEEYLGNHFGQSAMDFVQELKMHLERNKLHRVARKIDQLIEEKFNHRSRLNEH